MSPGLASTGQRHVIKIIGGGARILNENYPHDRRRENVIP